MSALPVPHPRRKLALLIALAADALQVVVLPFLFPVLPMVLDDAIDLVIGVVMVRLLGWHFAFLPTVIAELVPGVNLLPTWTAAVWFVTRKKAVPVSPAPPPPPALP